MHKKGIEKLLKLSEVMESPTTYKLFKKLYRKSNICSKIHPCLHRAP